MALLTLLQTLASVRVAPLEFLTSRRLGSLAMFLSGRDLALANHGIAGWSDLPIDKMIEAHYGIETMPWRTWADIVEYAALDEWDGFDRFLALAATWSEPGAAPPNVQQPGYTLAELLDRIEQRPEMYLGQSTLAGLADLVSGYATTANSIAMNADSDIAIYRALIADIESSFGSRSWFRALRFAVSSEEEALASFFERWRTAKGRT